MKKTLAIILSIVMLIGVLPFGALAADYDRAKIAADDEATIDALSDEQIASVILDWADRQIASYSAEVEQAIIDGVMADGGFDGFESFVSAELDNAINVQSIDDVIGYKDYLAQLGGDFAALDTASLVKRSDATSDLDFIYAVIQFMADNSEIFGKVFRWDDEVFDYGKVGEYIESLDTTDEDNKKIRDFYDNYLIGNDIQDKFIDWVADQMGYAYATDANGERTENFDDILNNGILGWFAGLCYKEGAANNILSEEAYKELLTYNLRTTDIYTLVKNFVALVQEDNQVKLDTYYNYIMDTVVRTLLKTTLGQKATVGAAATLPASFADTYTDLALLEEISGGTAYYQDADKNYYEVAIADGVATAKAVTWESVVDFEFPTATIYTGANCDEEVQVYYPTSADAVQVLTYATAKNQALVAQASTFEFTGAEVPAEFKALMTTENAKNLNNSFGLTIKQGETIVGEPLVITFEEIANAAEEKALPIAQQVLAETLATLPITVDVTIKAIDVVLGYNGYATEDEFICEVVIEDVAVTLGGSMAETASKFVDVNSLAKSQLEAQLDSPVATVVVDGISGGKGIDASGAKELYEFIDTDFVIDADLLDFIGNYDTYNGVVGQANRVLYDLVDMLVSDAGMEKLALAEGNNDNFTANLQKICDTANDMMASAEAIMTDEEVKSLLGQVGLDVESLLAGMDLDLLYAIDFSSVEGLWTSVIGLGLDLVDDGKNATIADIHAAVEGLTNLDAMAVAMADYLLGKCIPEANTKLADLGLNLAVPAETDAKTVENGEGKDIIMTKLVAVTYDAAVWGVGFLNDKVNELIGHVEGETNVDLPTIAFELGVTESEDWETTLTALVNRVYELADGIIIACDNDYTDTFDKIAAVANAVLPLGSLASNCASDNFAFDVNKVMGFLFDDGLNGKLDGFLRLFETQTKTEDVAADCSVTEALINASQHIVDSIFPGTVVAENYVNATSDKFTEETVQEYFTSAENDAVIASNNMDSINARKADLVPAALNLVREAGILPFFAKCDKDHTATDLETVLVPGTAATCTETGTEDAYACADCGYIVSGGGTIDALDHDWSDWTETKAPGCTTKGVETRTCSRGDATENRDVAATGHSYGAWKVVTAPGCGTNGTEKRTCACGAYEEHSLPALTHADADGNEVCDHCGADLHVEEELSFFDKIKAFFQKIIDWFKNLFS